MTDDPATDRPAAPPGQEASAYRVLARKYRPADFTGLVGQEAMVRTLTNAIRSGRLAQAYILTGVRGVGKTTTARIIARALNCAEGPTATPCGVCGHCTAIAADRHVDVIEMDAASRTGVDEIRELIESVRYAPVSARYKIYIVDEVHMLSKAAFNALLKTLEEPPEHVKFVFATTEIRKVPVTVLSRCQRFDLRRVDSDRLVALFRDIAAREGAQVSDTALALIARAADGSVRDGLSLLDQAISDSVGRVEEEVVRGMLGLADRTVTFDLFDAIMRGDTKAALALVGEQYRAGADPAVAIEDLLELSHWLTRLKIVPEAADAPTVPEADRVRGLKMAGALPMSALARAWQMLLKGLGEVRQAPSPLQAAEMVLVRLAYAADLPTPAEALGADGGRAGGDAPPPSRGGARIPPTGGSMAGTPPDLPRTRLAGGGAALGADTVMRPETGPASAEASPRATVRADPGEPAPAVPASLHDVIALAEARREAILKAELIACVHLVRFEPGRIEFRPAEGARSDLANRLSRFLNAETPLRWIVTVSSDAGMPTLGETRAEAEAAAKDRAARHPLVKAVLETFPGAVVERVRALPRPEPDPIPVDPDSDDVAE